MQVTTIPCLSDNYAYLLRTEDSREAVVVDPSESEPVLRELSTQGLTLVAVLCTHHHADHVGGNQELADLFPGLAVYGGESDRGRIPAQTKFLRHEQEITVAGLSFRVLHIPGHTLGAVAYIGHGAAFTGDTLFAAGCGRLFEGTPAMMYESLNRTLGQLPDETRIYCGHEYTASNLRFAAFVEPSNTAVITKAERVIQLRARGMPSVPSTMAEERATNPFLRCDSREIVEKVTPRLGEDRSPQAVLGAIRAEKDVFRS